VKSKDMADTPTMENGVKKKSYVAWRGMMERCYSDKYKEKYPTYSNCTMSNEWKSFSNFENWFCERYIEGFELDKDLLVFGNKHYSKETCRLIPKKLNYLFHSNEKKRGRYMIGVQYIDRLKKFRALGNIDGKRKHIGLYKTEIEAWEAYVSARMSYCTKVSNELYESNKIDIYLYHSLIRRISNMREHLKRKTATEKKNEEN